LSRPHPITADTVLEQHFADVGMAPAFFADSFAAIEYFPM